jgi:uncharacterized protein YciI
MPQFLYRIQPARPGFFGGPTADEEAAVSEHFAYLEDLTRRRVVVLAGRTLNEDLSAFGVVVFEAPSDAAAGDLMTRDPAVRAGVFSAELFPFRVALASPHVLDLAPPQNAPHGGEI